MPKEKKEVKKAVRKPKVKEEVLPSEADTQAATPNETANEIGFPLFEGAQVVQILEENVNGMWHSCAMSDGTTKHVPIALFSKQHGE